MSISMKYVFLILSLILFFIPSAFWTQNQVEDVFSDIQSDYDYIIELQALYNRGIIIPNDSGNFNPDQAVTREVFVWVNQEVQCDRCTSPRTSSSIIQKYINEELFFDIDSTSPYFYCVAEASTRNLISSYDVWESCDDGSNEFWKRPFCPQNTVSREEAVRTLLNNSNIFTSVDNDEVLSDIQNGTITENIWADVLSFTWDGSPNIFYWYLERALEYEIIEYDVFGNEKTYSFLEADADGNINPQAAISNEDFIRMAYIILKTNQCLEPQGSDIAVKTEVFDASCSQGEDCSLSNLNNPSFSYDFKSTLAWVCSEGIDTPTGYTWRFYNQTSWEEFFEYGSYLEDIVLTPTGQWKIYQSIEDRCGNTSQIYSTLLSPSTNSDENDSLSTLIGVNQISGDQNFFISLEANISWGTPPYTYSWDLWDGPVRQWKKIEYVYEDIGTYDIILAARDSLGFEGNASTIIQVLSGDACSRDTDNDGIGDCIDTCPLISWVEKNKGCPIYENRCDVDCTCDDGYICDDSDSLTCSTWGVCIPDFKIESSCLYNPNIWSVFGNTLCTTCPCTSNLDFLADIRRCDLLFPAITSPDGTEIYSQGDFWEVR